MVVDSGSLTGPALADAVALAADFAVDVDRSARFPAEAVGALRRGRLLVPSGSSAAYDLPNAQVLVEAVGSVSAACGSTGLVFAMHHSLVQAVVRSADPNVRQPIMSALTERQPLIAGITSEPTTGGALRQSDAFLQPGGTTTCAGTKEGAVASYVGEADAILLTMRRAPDADPSDQCLVLVWRDQCELDPGRPWQSLGMRGTDSRSVRISFEVPNDQIVVARFGPQAAEALTSAGYLLLAACWAGIARSAVSKARRRVRLADSSDARLASARELELVDLHRRYHMVEALVRDAAVRYEGRARVGGFATGIGVPASFRVAAAEACVESVIGAMRLIGLAGYLHADASEHSVERELRDVLSALVMVSDARIRAEASEAAPYARTARLGHDLGTPPDPASGSPS